MGLTVQVDHDRIVFQGDADAIAPRRAADNERVAVGPIGVGLEKTKLSEA